MAFAACRKNTVLMLQSGKAGFRNYGTTISKTPVQEQALILRGKIPCPPTDYKLLAGAIAGILLYGCARKYALYRRDEIKRSNYEQMVRSNMGPWRDFENRRMPKFAKVLANESPCGDPFKEAYMCAIFEEGSCSSQFESLLSCFEENPVMLRDVKADGNYNWASKLFLHNLLIEKKIFDNLIASVGPAEENMEDVYDSYRARELLGASASESEVNAFKEKFAALKAEFWAEVQALHDGEITDSAKADALLKKLKKEYSVPAAVWLQVMKDYDLEEFDELITHARRKYGAVLYHAHRQSKIGEVRDADLSGVTCGDQFDKMYQCMEHKGDRNDCLDFIDELYFCRQHHHKEVFPRSLNMTPGNYRTPGTTVFQTANPSFTAEMERSQQVLGYPGIVN